MAAPPPPRPWARLAPVAPSVARAPGRSRSERQVVARQWSGRRADQAQLAHRPVLAAHLAHASAGAARARRPGTPPASMTAVVRAITRAREAERTERTQAATRPAAGSSTSEVNSTGRPSRTAAASRAMTARRRPTSGARSVLLITSRSEKVTPGPPLRGTLSPPDTSSTKICWSASPSRERRGEVVAAALHQHQVEPGPKRASRSSTASRLAAMSSRIAVCGQQPVRTGVIRSASSTPARCRKSASSVV